MANKTDTTSIFRSIAGVAAVLMIATAALIFLQSGGGGGASTELAALSQAIPRQAEAAVAGKGSFDDLDARVGLAHTLIVLSADHGGPEAPGYLNELGFEGS